MFWVKKETNVERKLTQLNHLLARSFSNVKKDTQNIFQWLNFLYQKNMEQAAQIKKLKLELSYVPKNHYDIKKIIDSYYSFDHIMDKIKHLHEKVDNLDRQKVIQPQHHELHPKLNDMDQRLKQLEEEKKATIREKVVKRVTRNSKDYVKSLIISYIRKYGQIGALQLKDMVVHDQGLCSKSSFYRLLDELEALDEVGTVKKGKQKYYLYKQIKEQ